MCERRGEIQPICSPLEELMLKSSVSIEIPCNRGSSGNSGNSGSLSLIARASLCLHLFSGDCGR
jgi:hypothetical protein